ncbi:transcription factor Adf-1-like [Tribolium madens]|uniref:transcription factor Adf-1-like n=1 Tax=Tribolium madens TaxID=41895 RepID=UPI001CF75307|nr:transcription factor Adf-1-like [Tribolium madens]
MTHVSMEDILIEEVRQRPSIYDKTTLVYKNNRIRDQEWKEVAKAVNMNDVEAVKKRWRSLRDSFIKIQRSLKLNPKQAVKWIYYSRLMFLIPHIESKELVVDGSKNEEEDEATQEVENGTDYRYVPEDAGFSDVSTSSKQEISTKRKRNIVDEDPLMTADQFFESCAKKRGDLLGDADEQFLLSCLPALKRLLPKENALARMRIQQVLFEIEFGTCDQSNIVITKEEVIE